MQRMTVLGDCLALMFELVLSGAYGDLVGPGGLCRCPMTEFLRMLWPFIYTAV